MSDHSNHATDDVIAEILRKYSANDQDNQIRALAQRMGDVASMVAVHDERDKAIVSRLASIEKKFDTMAVQLSSIEGTANRWRGAFGLLLGVSGITGIVVAGWDRFAAWVHPVLRSN